MHRVSSMAELPSFLYSARLRCLSRGRRRFKSVWSSSLYLAVNDCNGPKKEAPAGACVPCENAALWQYLCPPPSEVKLAEA